MRLIRLACLLAIVGCSNDQGGIMTSGRDVTLAFSPSGKEIALSDSDGTTVWSLDGKVVQRFGDRRGHVVFSPDGKYLAWQGASVAFWNLAIHREHGPLEGVLGLALKLVFSHDSKHVAIARRHVKKGHGSVVVHVHDVESLKELSAFDLSDRDQLLGFHADNRSLVCLHHGTPFLTKLTDGKAIPLKLTDLDRASSRHPWVLSPSGRYLAASIYDPLVEDGNIDKKPVGSTVMVWNLDRGSAHCMERLYPSSDTKDEIAVAFSQDEKTLMTGCPANDTVNLMENATGKRRRAIDATHPVWSPDGRVFVFRKNRLVVLSDSINSDSAR